MSQIVPPQDIPVDEPQACPVDQESVQGQEEAFVNQSSFYDLLEVSRTATQKEIKAQFLKLSLKYHPDKETGDPQKFKSLMQAYKVLSSKKRRKTYDQSLSNTWSELRTVKRDVEYHRTEKHTKLDERTGERIFDEASFNAAFEGERNDGDASEIRGMLEDLEKSGRAVEKDLDEQLGAWDRLKAEREEEEKRRAEEVETLEGVTLNSLRDDFNSNIFNQMFNDMKAKKKEMVDYDVRNDDEFLQHFDQRDMGMWQGEGGVGGSMFGASMGSNMGGLEALGGLRYDGGDDSLIGEFGNKTYEDRPEVTYTRDLEEEAREAQLTEYQQRIKDIQAERENLMYMSKEDYIIRDSVIGEALGDLGDPSLFDDTIMTLDPGLGYDTNDNTNHNDSNDNVNDDDDNNADN